MVCITRTHSSNYNNYKKKEIISFCRVCELTGTLFSKHKETSRASTRWTTITQTPTGCMLYSALATRTALLKISPRENERGIVTQRKQIKIFTWVTGWVMELNFYYGTGIPSTNFRIFKIYQNKFNINKEEIEHPGSSFRLICMHVYLCMQKSLFWSLFSRRVGVAS